MFLNPEIQQRDLVRTVMNLVSLAMCSHQCQHQLKMCKEMFPAELQCCVSVRTQLQKLARESLQRVNQGEQWSLFSMIRLESDHSMKLQHVDLTLTSNSSISKFIRCFLLLISNSKFNFIHEM